MVSRIRYLKTKHESLLLLPVIVIASTAFYSVNKFLVFPSVGWRGTGKRTRSVFASYKTVDAKIIAAPSFSPRSPPRPICFALLQSLAPESRLDRTFPRNVPLAEGRKKEVATTVKSMKESTWKTSSQLLRRGEGSSTSRCSSSDASNAPSSAAFDESSDEFERIARNFVR